MSGYKTAQTSARAPTDSKSVSDHTMLAQLDLVEINRIELCSSGFEVVRNRGQENTSGRPNGTNGQERRHMQCDTGRHQQSRTGKHIRPPLYMYTARIDEHKKEVVGPEVGRAEPQERGSAGGAPRREETPHKRERPNG